MSWKQLTIDDLRLVLAEDEVDKLNEVSLDPSLSTVIQDQLDMVSDAYRGSWRSKGYTIDVRDHYVAPEYRNAVLNYARFQIFTRFPMTPSFALDENRKKQYEEATELLKNPYIGVSKPDYSDDPELSSMAQHDHDAAISMPWLKFPTMPFDTGFYKPYALYFDNMEEGI